jgi:hypothetical protein
MMAKKRASKKEEKSYSYQEFLKTFYPRPQEERNETPRDPKVFGSKLAEAALKKIRESQEAR